ncbi:hypothetical protein C8R45DRAFT_946892 [Mycena sanguinolenta]|nr:hypothetical protein C8R45DRAFT_946892 [Mycena sanguinolenta]
MASVGPTPVKCHEPTAMALARSVITADDLAVVIIFQKGKHDEASAQQMRYLMFSRFLRLQIMDRFRRFGAKVTAVQQDLVDQFLLPSSTGPSEPLPPHRIPTTPQIQGMLSATKQRTRLAVNPFLATWLMVKRNTRDMYKFGVQVHGSNNGRYHSQYCGAKRDYFPTTAVCTADDGNHVMPGAYLISANIKAKTIKHFFVETVHKIESGAREVAADKSRSELNGLLGAILRFDFDDGHQGLGFSIPISVKAEILVLFCKLQRCRSWDSWEETKRIFHAGLTELLGDSDPESLKEQAATEQVEATQDDPVPEPAPTAPSQRSHRAPRPKTKKAKAEGRTCLEVVQAYFDKNWFVELWIDMFTDIGLPDGQSRDDTWNTNNWADSGFKQFNAVFLDNEHNKRFDQLASIILNDHLPFFGFFRTPDRPQSNALIELHHRANRLWETDAVSTMSDPDQFIVRRTDSDCEDSQSKRAGDRLERSQEMKAEKRALRRQEKGKNSAKNQKQSPDSKLPQDETIERELENVLNKLRHWEESESEKKLNINGKFGKNQGWIMFASIQFENCRGTVKTSAGRPANAQPLRPWCRNKRAYASQGTYGYSPRFVKKRGKPKHTCWNHNSLLPALNRKELAWRAVLRRRPVATKFTVNATKHQATTPQISDPASPVPLAPGDGDLNPEDLALTRRTRNGSTPMITCFEWMKLLLCGGPEIGFAEKLRSVDWTQPFSVNQLRDFEIEAILELVESRKNAQVNGIVYFELRAGHWTTFYHKLAAAPPRNLFVVSPTYLGLQEDSFTSGFWAIYMGISLLLDFQAVNSVILDTRGTSRGQFVKELIVPIYISFKGDEVGVPTSLVHNLFLQFKPHVDLGRLPPESIPSTGPLPPANLVVLDGTFDELLRKDNDQYNWVIGTTATLTRPSGTLRLEVTVERLQKLVGYGRWEWKQHQDIIAVSVTDCIFGKELVEAKRSAQGMAPPERHNINIFTKDRLIIPLFWPALKHWLVVAADAPDAEFTVPVSQQDNAVDCGIYTIIFAQAIAQNVDPSTLVLTNTAVQQSRLQIANRFNRAIRAHPMKSTALGIPISLPSTPGENTIIPAPPAHTGRKIPAHPIGHIAFFPSESGNLFLPAETVESTSDGGFRLEWRSQRLVMEDSDKPTGDFTCTRDVWLEAASRLCHVDQLVPVTWPTALLNFGRKDFASFGFESDRALAKALEEHTDLLVCQLTGLDNEDPIFSQIKAEFGKDNPSRSSDPSAIMVPFENNLFPSFLLLQPLMTSRTEWLNALAMLRFSVKYGVEGETGDLGGGGISADELLRVAVPDLPPPAPVILAHVGDM